MTRETSINTRKKTSNKNQTIIFVATLSYLAVAMLGSIGIYRLVNFEISLLLIASICIISFSLIVKTPLSRKQLFVLLTFSILFIQTLAASKYVAISAVNAFYLITSAAFFVSLQQSRYIFSHTESTINAIDGAKYAFIIFAVLHAITLVIFYLFEPGRTSGLLDDFSQASMLLLLAIGFAYPLWKDKSFFSAFSLLLFLAFFTSYSRTANFLLVVFLAILFLVERRKGSGGTVVKLCVLAAIAAFIVNIYPELVGKETISRGGLSHLSTLNSRTIYWQTAWDAILERPWLGWGLQTYAWTGIQETQPFNIIYFVHNDYLQIWHDLGVFWLLLFVGVYAFVLFKHLPIKIKLGRTVSLYYAEQALTKTLAWLVLFSIALYMCINFLILSFEFQIGIAILLADLLEND